MQSGCNSSPMLLLTYIMPSLTIWEILLSSDRITLSYYSAVHLTCVSAQFNLFNLCYKDKNDFLCGILSFKTNPCRLPQKFRKFLMICYIRQLASDGNTYLISSSYSRKLSLSLFLTT